MPAKTGAPHDGAALLRRTSVLAAGPNLDAGRIHFARALQLPKGGAALWAAEPKIKGHPKGCPFILVRPAGFESAVFRVRVVRRSNVESLRRSGFADFCNCNLNGTPSTRVSDSVSQYKSVNRIRLFLIATTTQQSIRGPYFAFLEIQPGVMLYSAVQRHQLE